MNKVRLSVILPCLNCESVIATQLSALEQQRCDRPWEIIISDNGSTDKTLEIVQQYQSRLPHLRVIDSSARRGAGPARNLAVPFAQGDCIVFCDADDQVCPGWLQALANALDHHQLVAGALDLLALNQPWRIPDQHHFGTRESPHTEAFRYRHAPHLRHASASNLALHKDLHFRINGFDESIAFNQDMDDCLRLQKLGCQLTFVPEAVINYRLRHSMAGTYRQGYRWGKYSVLIYKKHLGDQDIVQQFRFVFGGWRHLPAMILKLRQRSDLFELAGWLGGRFGEINGCLTYLLAPKLKLGSQPLGNSG